jgi:hypothetical protein
VGAHEEQPLTATLQPTVRIGRRVPNVEIENLAKVAHRSAAHHRVCGTRVNDEDPRVSYGPGASEPPDEEDANATGTAATPQVVFKVRRQPSVAQCLHAPWAGHLEEQIPVDLRSGSG